MTNPMDTHLILYSFCFSLTLWTDVLQLLASSSCTMVGALGGLWYAHLLQMSMAFGAGHDCSVSLFTIRTTDHPNLAFSLPDHVDYFCALAGASGSFSHCGDVCPNCLHVRLPPSLTFPFTWPALNGSVPNLSYQSVQNLVIPYLLKL